LKQDCSRFCEINGGILSGILGAFSLSIGFAMLVSTKDIPTDCFKKSLYFTSVTLLDFAVVIISGCNNDRLCTI